MANPNAAHEPSMEEILASIRQIISEDGGSAAPKIDGVRAAPADSPRSEPAAQPPSAADNGPKEDDEPPAFVMGGRPAFPRAPVVEPEDSTEGETYASGTSGTAVALGMPRTFGDAPLLSAESGSAVSGAFGALAHTFLEQNARTLEDVVTEMLQPMLKEWLDDNLPSIVERKVREEIERVSRGRR